MPDSVVPEVVEKEMALTRGDVARLLPAAAGTLAVTVDGDRYRLGDAAAGVEIHLYPQPDRRIALIRLPVMRVTLTFHGFDPPARRAFLDRFDTAFRRGGG